MENYNTSPSNKEKTNNEHLRNLFVEKFDTNRNREQPEPNWENTANIRNTNTHEAHLRPSNYVWNKT
jgi:hypothetical protein